MVGLAALPDECPAATTTTIAANIQATTHRVGLSHARKSLSRTSQYGAMVTSRACNVKRRAVVFSRLVALRNLQCPNRAFGNGEGYAFNPMKIQPR